MIVIQRYGYHNYEEHDYLMTSGCIFKRSFKEVSFIIFTFRQFLFCCLTKPIDIGTKLGQHFGGENFGFMYNVGCLSGTSFEEVTPKTVLQKKLKLTLM
jgi:hypothetical protein